MTLLLRDTDTNAGAPAGEPAGATPADAPPQTAACPKCHAPVEPGQDWCLNCGEAQASRRLTLPGKRAAATVLALTTVLVAGAVAASYAALQDGTEAPASTPTQVAQAPAPAPAPATPVTPDPSATAPSSTAPADPTASAPSGDSSPLPDVDSTPATPTPSTATGDTSTGVGSSDTTTDDSSTSTGDSSAGDTPAETRTSTTPADTKPVAIKVGDGAATLYDPYKRDTAAGDPAKALDGDPNTSFPVTVATGSAQIGAGLTVDLGKKQGLREIDLTTKTPGFKIEIYATDETDLPPDVLDTRWAHLKDVTGVGSDSDGKEVVSLGAGSTKYRHVLLWFTAPPTDGSTVRVSELKLLG
ncbi:MAG TPA: hypothetical protein VNT03_06610 [Baekduia sp.]|nr:hypothetical protein [Baekduia sp.]